MRSDAENFLRTLFQWLHQIGVDLGGVAFVLLGVLLVAGVISGALVLRKLIRGGFSRGNGRFFTERRVIEHYLRHE